MEGRNLRIACEFARPPEPGPELAAAIEELALAGRPVVHVPGGRLACGAPVSGGTVPRISSRLPGFVDETPFAHPRWRRAEDSYKDPQRRRAALAYRAHILGERDWASSRQNKNVNLGCILLAWRGLWPWNLFDAGKPVPRDWYKRGPAVTEWEWWASGGCDG